jgi:hypothetical protein
MKTLTPTPIAAAARIGLLALSLLGAAHSAAAQQPNQAQVSAIRSACRSDYQSHCASVPTGGAAALQCLQKNVASLSAPCQQAVNAAGGGTQAAPSGAATTSTPVTASPAASANTAAPAKDAATTPASDAGTPTSAAKPTEQSATAKPVTTAPAGSATVAPAKSAATKQPSKAQASAIRTACRADFPSHCPGVQPGGAAAWSCLHANVASVSPPCEQAVYTVTGATPVKAAVAVPTADAAPSPSGAPAAAAVPAPTGPAVTPREKLLLLRTACGGDFRNFCPGVPLGGGRAIECREAKAASLSPNCQSALASLQR